MADLGVLFDSRKGGRVTRGCGGTLKTLLQRSQKELRKSGSPLCPLKNGNTLAGVLGS